LWMTRIVRDQRVRWREGDGRALRLFWPGASVVIDAQNLQRRAADSIGDNEGRFRNDEFACSGDAAGVAEPRIWRQQLFDAMQNVQGDAYCRRRIVYRNLCAQRIEIVDRAVMENVSAIRNTDLATRRPYDEGMCPIIPYGYSWALRVAGIRGRRRRQGNMVGVSRDRERAAALSDKPRGNG